jgi:hypothetical protein
VTDLEVYLAAPEKSRPSVSQIQDAANRMLADARTLGMPRDTFAEILRARNERIVEAAVENAARAGSDPMIVRACCECKAFLGTKPCEPQMAGSVSHGFCDPCAAEFRRKAGL